MSVPLTLYELLFRQGSCVFINVCLFVCLFVYATTKFGGKLAHRSRRKALDFGGKFRFAFTLGLGNAVFDFAAPSNDFLWPLAVDQHCYNG